MVHCLVVVMIWFLGILNVFEVVGQSISIAQHQSAAEGGCVYHIASLLYGFVMFAVDIV